MYHHMKCNVFMYSSSNARRMPKSDLSCAHIFLTFKISRKNTYPSIYTYINIAIYYIYIYDRLVSKIQFFTMRICVWLCK